MNEAAEQALSNFQHEQALSIAHARRAEGYLAQFLSMVSQKDGKRTPSGLTVRCVREWTRWLSDNGPATRAHITEQTGVKFSERGTPHTFVWDDSMVDDPDDALPPNAIMRMRGAPNPGRGAPPVIFFLWSQRWDVHPLFGVGPVKPDNMPVALDDDNLDTWAPEPNPVHTMEPQQTWLTDSSGKSRPVVRVPLRDEWEMEDQPVRFATIGEWDAYYAPTFDALVSADVKPSDEQKQTMRDTLPEGADANAALAIAYRNAVLRSRQPSAMTGVVQPRPPDLSGVEVVGSHNHVPHIYGPLCQVSDCRPA